ncbi:hypothetical protein AAOGI_41500 [Agarivorans albus]
MECSMKILILSLICICFSSLADTTAKIEKILMYEQGDIVYIYPTGGVQNAPSCHGSNGDYLSFSFSRPMAKEYLSVLMMAFVAKKTVFFRTARACVDQPVSDTIEYFMVM